MALSKERQQELDKLVHEYVKTGTWSSDAALDATELANMRSQLLKNSKIGTPAEQGQTLLDF